MQLTTSASHPDFPSLQLIRMSSDCQVWSMVNRSNCQLRMSPASMSLFKNGQKKWASIDSQALEALERVCPCPVLIFSWECLGGQNINGRLGNVREKVYYRPHWDESCVKNFSFFLFFFKKSLFYNNKNYLTKRVFQALPGTPEKINSRTKQLLVIDVSVWPCSAKSRGKNIIQWHMKCKILTQLDCPRKK